MIYSRGTFFIRKEATGKGIMTDMRPSYCLRNGCESLLQSAEKILAILMFPVGLVQPSLNLMD